jgi:hypothetical protein
MKTVNSKRALAGASLRKIDEQDRILKRLNINEIFLRCKQPGTAAFGADPHEQ